MQNSWAATGCSVKAPDRCGPMETVHAWQQMRVQHIAGGLRLWRRSPLIWAPSQTSIPMYMTCHPSLAVRTYQSILLASLLASHLLHCQMLPLHCGLVLRHAGLSCADSDCGVSLFACAILCHTVLHCGVILYM